MYVGFEVTDYQTLLGWPLKEIFAYKLRSRGRITNLASHIIGFYKGRHVLDAKTISSALFPEGRYDVFLSHSHGDQNKAVDLALALEKKGLKVFVDSGVWGYFGDLINLIVAAETNAPNELPVQRVSEISANVHMMLSGALQNIILGAEAFVFLNTEKSVPLTYESAAKTFSPWLYSELQFSFQVERIVPKRIKAEMFDSVKGVEMLTESLASNQLLMAFPAFNDHLPKVDGASFSRWHQSAPSNIKEGYVLDSLYKEFGLRHRYEALRQDILKRQSIKCR